MKGLHNPLVLGAPAITCLSVCFWLCCHPDAHTVGSGNALGIHFQIYVSGKKIWNVLKVKQALSRRSGIPPTRCIQWEHCGALRKVQ